MIEGIGQKPCQIWPADTTLIGPVGVIEEQSRTDHLAGFPPIASLTTQYTPPRTNIELDSMYSARAA